MGLVYFLKQEGRDYFKVGATTKDTPNARLRGAITGSPEKLSVYLTLETLHPFELEHLCHDILAEYRVTPNREWFAVKPDTIDKLFGNGAKQQIGAIQIRYTKYGAWLESADSNWKTSYAHTWGELEHHLRQYIKDIEALIEQTPFSPNNSIAIFPGGEHPHDQ